MVTLVVGCGLGDSNSDVTSATRGMTKWVVVWLRGQLVGRSGVTTVDGDISGGGVASEDSDIGVSGAMRGCDDGGGAGLAPGEQLSWW